MAIRWRDRAIIPAPPVSEQRLAEVEHRLEVAFPDDYLEVIRTHQGASPDRNTVRLPDGTATTFSMLLRFEDQPDGLDLLGIAEASGVLPARVIPFAVDPGDNYLCFDYRSTDTDPPVVFLAHDEVDAQPQRIAGSFTELIDSLTE